MVTEPAILCTGRVGRTSHLPPPQGGATTLDTHAPVRSERPTTLACHRRELFVSSQFAVATVECAADSWAGLPAHVANADEIVVVRTGRFGRRVRGSFSLLDSTQAYLRHRGEEELIQHATGVGHRCTVLSLRSEGFPTTLGLRSRFGHTEFRTSPRTDLEHRMVLAACRRGGDATAIDALLRSLVDQLLAGCELSSHRRGRPSTAAAARRVVDSGRESMDSLVTPRSLHSLAAAASVSPQQLARVFKASTGLTVGQYRSRIRVRLALERLGEGASDLSRLAHDLGYFDHSHFSRTLTAELGLAPRVLRDLLSGDATRHVYENARS
jgi:AraC-like DNA-binding protein